MALKTRTGSKMIDSTKEKLLSVMCNPEHEGKTQKEIAAILGVTPRTVYNYLTPEMWQEIHNRRLDVINRSLVMVDKAVYHKAINGDMTAAKILYNRWDNLKKEEQLKQLATPNDEELEEIERLEQQIQELENASKHIKEEEASASTKEATKVTRKI